ncbi:MAG: PQQ-binding-like beta-propeller repeat protein [Cyanobacteria bacterium SZAS LIN-2]|nr:PQQ-binding-like beta-propeller repeat protein [Cyanobacteria bacterium SZAS LIN-2]
MSSPLFTKGDRLENGHYTVLQEVGLGGMGVVYHSRDELLLRDVAIKMLLPSLMTDKKNVDVFREEARLAAGLEHPNIVTVYDVGAEMRDGLEHYFVAMEYLPGGTLASRINQGPLPLKHCLNWMKQLASGLSFAHKRGVIHQDIKADNIFITHEGDLKIGDFGLARLLPGRIYINSSTRGMGTPAYMSPELCRGEPQDHRSDIYSMGILFYEMCTGQLPYRAQGMVEMAMKHTNAPIPSARKANLLVPDVLDRVIKRMMAKAPEERFKSMTDVLGIIDDLIFEMRVAHMGLTPRGLPKVPDVIDMDAILASAQAGPASPIDPVTSETSRVLPAGAKIFDASPFLEAEDDGSVKKVSAFPAYPGFASSEPNYGELEIDNRKQLNFERRTPSKPNFDGTASGVSFAAIGSPASASNTSTNMDAVAASSSPVKKPDTEAVWAYATKGPIGWMASPCLSRDEKLVYVCSADGRLYAVDSRSGKLAFSYDAKAPLLSSPLITDEKLILTDTQGKVHALDPQTGTDIWVVESNSNNVASMVASPVVHGHSVIVCDRRGVVTALDIRLGMKLWTFTAADAIVAAPKVHGDKLYFGTRGGQVYAINCSTGKQAWKYVAAGKILSTPVTSVDTVYVGSQSGLFFALDADAGRLTWEMQTEGAIATGGVLVYTSIIFASQDKWLYCCEKYDGSLKWKVPLKGTPSATLEAVGSTVVCVTKEGWLQAFDTENGKLAYESFLKKDIESAPLLLGKKIFVGSVDGALSCFELTQQAGPEKAARS